jgi:hypothetical protein
VAPAVPAGHRSNRDEPADRANRSRPTLIFRHAEIDRRITAVVNRSLPIADLAARLVDIEVVFASTGPRTRIGGFDTTAFLRRIGRHQVSTARAHRDSAAEGTPSQTAVRRWWTMVANRST